MSHFYPLFKFDKVSDKTSTQYLYFFRIINIFDSDPGRQKDWIQDKKDKK